MPIIDRTANPERLKGFSAVRWTDKAQMPDETLKNLIEHFSKHTLSLANVPEDELATATSTSSSSSPMTRATPPRSSTPTARSCT